jgi:hypothetical protein
MPTPERHLECESEEDLQLRASPAGVAKTLGVSQ